MKLKMNISLLQTSVMALVTGMMFSCTGDLEEKSEFTSDPIVINLVSAADADIMPIAGTRSLSEDEHHCLKTNIPIGVFWSTSLVIKCISAVLKPRGRQRRPLHAEQRSLLRTLLILVSVLQYILHPAPIHRQDADRISIRNP